MLDGNSSTTLRARYVFPISGPPLADAALTITGTSISAVGPRDDRSADHSGDVVDLGSAAILPGFVNAHTHLEFSDLTAPLGRPGIAFPDWIRAVVTHRRSRTVADRRTAVRQGLDESARSGTTSLGEIATVGWPAELFFGDVAPKVQPAATIFLELLGLSTERTAANMAAAKEHVLRSNSVGLSPHAPYTVRTEMVKFAAELSRSEHLPLAMHLAESPEEIQLLRGGDGPMYELLRDFGVWDPAAFPRGARPLDYLRLLAEADRSLVIHGTYLDDEEIAFLAAHADCMAVVYCPRTHAYFPHAPYPLAKLLAAGVTVALGTDSRASNPNLSLLEELRFAGALHAVAPAQLVALATIGGARALGREKESGSLTAGKSADLCVVRLPNVETDPYELLLDPRSTVVATVCAGVLLVGSL